MGQTTAGADRQVAPHCNSKWTMAPTCHTRRPAPGDAVRGHGRSYYMT